MSGVTSSGVETAPLEPSPVATPARVGGISVVVASTRDRRLIEACLRSLLPQCVRLSAEVIVARDELRNDLASLQESFPEVRFLPAPANAAMPVVRGVGLAAARGVLVALTEDHCVVAPRWLEELVRHAEPGIDVVGGGMDNAQRQRAIEWGAFFAEYGLYAATRCRVSEPSTELTAANVAYGRRIVEDVARWNLAGDWDNVVHDRLAARSAAMRFVPSATVLQNLTYTLRGFVVDRFSHGFNFARNRAEGRSIAWRLPVALLTPVLPIVFVSRLARTATSGRWPIFLRALPVTITFLAAWSVGEAVGYIVGRNHADP